MSWKKHYTGILTVLLSMAVVLVLSGDRNAPASPPMGLSLTTYQQSFERSYALEALRHYGPAIRPLLRLYHNPKYKKLPTRYFVALRLGFLYYRNADYRNAIKYYTAAAALRPTAVEPRLGMMLPLTSWGRRNRNYFDRAIQIGRQVLAVDKTNYFAITRLAYLHYLKREFKNAVQYYNWLVKMYPGNLQFRYWYAMSLLGAGNKAQAKRQFQWIVRVSPANQLALFGLRKAMK